MSTNVNTRLLERAAEVCDYFESTIIEEAIEELIKHNELEELAAFVSQQEAEIARQEFFNNDIIGDRDEY